MKIEDAEWNQPTILLANDENALAAQEKNDGALEEARKKFYNDKVIRSSIYDMIILYR